MILGCIIFLFMSISAIYSLFKWSNYKGNLESFLNLHCICALIATAIAVLHIITESVEFKFSVEYICMISMLGATITGIPLKIIFKDKPYRIKVIWPFHIGFAITFIVSLILHIVMVFAL